MIVKEEEVLRRRQKRLRVRLRLQNEIEKIMDPFTETSFRSLFCVCVFVGVGAVVIVEVVVVGEEDPKTVKLTTS